MKLFFVAAASLLMGFMLAVPCLAGHIQVKCEPGIQIYLDGELKGLSSSDVGGLILQDVLPGSHRLRAVKSGFTPREETVTISGSEVKVWNIEKFVPQVRISQEGQAVQAKIEQKAGTLVIQTLPVEAKIEIPSLGINQGKDKDLLKFESVPEGEYDVRVSGIGKNLLYRVQITANGTSRLFFNLMTGKVDDPDAPVRKKIDEDNRKQTEVKKKSIPNMASTSPYPIKNDAANDMIKAAMMAALNDNQNQLNSIVESIKGLPKPARGDRKIARKLNQEGLLYIQNKAYEKAVNKLLDAYRSDLSDQEIVNNLGYALILNGQLDEAEKKLLSAIVIEPTRTSAWINLGMVYAKKNDSQNAIGSMMIAYLYSSNKDKTVNFLKQLSDAGSSIEKEIVSDVLNRISRI